MSDVSPEPIDADDPRLTAFALGELEGADAARYAQAVAESAELRALVLEIQATACMLSTELRAEPAVAVSAERRAEIVAQATRPQAIATSPQQPRRLGKVWRGAAIAASTVVAGTVGFALFGPQATRSTDVAQTKLIAQANSSRAQSLLGGKLGGSDVDVAASTSTTQPSTFSVLSEESAPDSLQVVVSGSGSREKARAAGGGAGVPHNVEYDFALAPETRQAVGSGGGQPAGMSTGATVRLSARHNPLPLEPGAKPGQQPASLAGKPYGSNPAKELKDLSQLQAGESLNYKESLTRPILTESRAPSSESKDSGKRGRASGLDSAPLPLAAPRDLVRRGDYPKLGTIVGLERQLQFITDLQVEAKPNAGKPNTQKPSEPSKLDKLADKEVAEAEVALVEVARHKGFEEREEREARAKTLAPLGWRLVEIPWNEDPTSNEAYNPIVDNVPVSPAEQPLSTFSIDVDTASYANLRRFLQNGQLPPPDAVRVEELVNYFAYQYPQPQDGRPFSVQTDIAACPWQPGHHLVRIGLKGKEIPKEQRPPTNLVFLVDVSGSMSAANKLPLVRESLTTLVKQLDERDKIAIVTYAGEAGLRLPSTSVAQRETILAAIAGLGAGGSTNGAAGINTAYDIAAQEFIEKGTNRVILCTDGDFNVGVTSDDALVQMIQTRARGGVFLSIFGFGMGNLKDAKLEQLADKGNGQYGYIDDQQEANKVFIEEMMGTLVTIAKDVKIQIDFNKEAVASYRLVGYENRVMAAEDFHNDKKDAGEIGSGHTVTALYEIAPAKDLKVDDKTRWLTVKLRYKQPEASESVLFENPLVGPAGQLKLAPSDFQFAAGVAACGMLLRHSDYAGQANWALVKELAQSGLSFDPHGHRRAFLGLVAQAESLMGQLRPASPPAPDSTIRGKYKSLLRKLNAPEDEQKYGQFNDFGYSDTKSWAGSDNLPAGYWVYIAPHWYIWAESTAPDKPNPKALGF